MSKKAPAKPAFSTLNEHLVCTLCNGYFVDATTIVECLHSFCRSCIVTYLQKSSFCPRCEVQLHKGSPLRSLKPDKTLQDIVFKLVPNLFHNEMQRRREYYDAHPQYADQTTPEQRGDCLERFYSPDDSISLSLEYHDRRKYAGKTSTPDQKILPPKRYLKCPALFTVGLLKKFLRLKFDLPKEILIDIFQRRESLNDEYTLLDIAYIYPWKRSEPMRFFYRVRDPRVPESDDEVEREMPSLCAAVSGRATRASRRASSASSLASPLGSPRASPVPSAKRPKTELAVEDKDDSPPPARLTTQPPPGTVLAKPKPAAPAAPSAPAASSPPKVTSPTSTGPKITLTISPSRGTVYSTTTELPKNDTPAKKSAIPAAAPAPAPAKNNGTPSASKAPTFAATVTTKTANGGFITVKNPIARTPNGVMVGNKITPSASPAAKTPVPASKLPGHTPIAPKPAQPAPKRLPTLAPKMDMTPPSTAQSRPQPAVQAPARAATPAADKRAPANNLPAAVAAAPSSKPPQQVVDDEKNKVETAKAILQLSMGLQHNSRSNTPTDSTLHNRIDKIVKDLQDDESNDGTLVIKSEPSSPAGSHGSPRNSPVPRDAASSNPTAATPPVSTSTPRTDASLPPSLPRVNGLTITPIEPTKRKATSSPTVDDKKAKLDNKRPSDSPMGNAAPAKVAKVDKIAESIKQKQEMLIRQQEKRPPTPQMSSPGPIANLPPGLTIHPQTSSPQSRPPAQVKPAGAGASPAQGQQQQGKPAGPPLLPKPTPTTYKPQNQQAKLGQLYQQSQQSKLQGLQPKAAAQQAKATQQQQVQQAKPAQQGQQVKQTLQSYPAKTNQQGPPKPAPQAQQDKPQQMQPSKPSPQGQQAKPQQVLAPKSSPQGQHTKPLQVQPSKPSPQGQQVKPPQVQPSKPSPQHLQVQPSKPSPQGQQTKPLQVQPSKPSPQGQQTKPLHVQPSKPSPQGQQAQPAQSPASQQAQQAKPPGAQQVQPAKPSPGQQPKAATQQTQPPKPSPTAQQPAKKSTSPDSPVKNKKPIPDLQRLQRPPTSLSGTTVNGSLSLAEVKEHLAKKGQYSPPAPNRTPPRLIEITQPPPPPQQQQQQRKSPSGSSFGALDLSSASPRADHGGGWTPPPGFMTQTLAQTLAKRQQLMSQMRPPPSSLSSSSPSPPADGPASPDMYLDPVVLAQQQALIQHLHVQSLLQAQAAGLKANLHQAGLSAGLKKAIEDWSASERIGVKATAKRK
ncbi:Polycomb complex protein BMI-1 [Frankliniella fusca]|uniref:Polycomb complex protein BMI-1 n=1 Tax=Frankliniella fusca TaxID=407009 RepID=A0AAE1LAJ6_9NEOP|nr:Polycomb complex protein BMI-1 [Frankliniella fusca]